MIEERLQRILNHHHPPYKWTRLLAESFFTEGCPSIMSRPDCFLSSIIEVVSERGAYLAFQFDGCDQLSLVEHQSQEPVHVLASGDSCTFTLVSLARLYLFLSCCFAVAPKLLHGFAGFLFVVDEIERHLFSISPEGRSFFLA